MLEVGLGGRLDAVNAFDADCALVMSVALDHMDYLGDTREAIGREKAGIFRAGRPAICARSAIRRERCSTTRATSARSSCSIGRDFGFVAEAQQWRYWGPRGERHGLPHPALRGDYQIANAAACLAALDALRERLPVSAERHAHGTAHRGESGALPGAARAPRGDPRRRAQSCRGAGAARSNLARMPRAGRTFAVFAMLKDKDIAGVDRGDAAPTSTNGS